MTDPAPVAPRRATAARSAPPFAVEPLERRRLLSAAPDDALRFDDLDAAGPTHADYAVGPATGGSADFVAGNTRWPQATPPDGSTGAAGPVDLSFSFSNLLDGGMKGGLSAAQLRGAVYEALQVWAGAAPFRFRELPDAGPPVADASYADAAPDLRYGHHYIDGEAGSNVLAHAYYPTQRIGNTLYNRGLGGDVHFDSGNTWRLGQSGAGTDLIEVALHETGHALGLAHEVDTDADGPDTQVDAIMNPFVGRRFSGPGAAFLLPDDVAGIRSVYGDGLGYVLAGDTLYVSGTEASEAMTLGLDDAGQIVVGRDALRAVVPAADAAAVRAIVLNPRGGSDAVTVTGLAAGVALTVNGAAGDDTLSLGADVAAGGAGLSGVLGSVTFNGGSGTDAAVVSDAGSSVGRAYAVDAAGVSVAGGPTLAAFSVERVDLAAGDAADSVSVSGATAGAALTVNAGGGADVVAVGDLAPSAVVAVDGGAGLDAVRVNANGEAGYAAVAFASSQDLAELSVGPRGRVSLAAPVLSTRSLALSGGRVEIGGNALVVDYDAGAASPLASVRSAVIAGRNGGTWDGAGVTSNAAAASPAATALGFADSADLLGADGTTRGGGTLGGVAVDGSAVVVRYTLIGDATLDRAVGGADFRRAAASFASRGEFASWSDGDADFDGDVDGADLTAIVSALGRTLPVAPAPLFASASVGLARALPLPTAPVSSPAPNPGAYADDARTAPPPAAPLPTRGGTRVPFGPTLARPTFGLPTRAASPVPADGAGDVLASVAARRAASPFGATPIRA